MRLLKNLFQYRELLKTNIKKEIRGRYKKSFLGVLWSFINPLLQVLVYAIVFPFVMKLNQDHYVIYLITGVIPWTFFTTCLNAGTNCIWTSGGIIKKVYFPREILPISVVMSALVNFLISCIVIIIFVLLGGLSITFNILWLPIIAIIEGLLSLGFLFITCSIGVYIRDIEYIVQFIVNLMFYATPILYSSAIFPETFRFILYLNPMSAVIDAYRSIFYSGTMPDVRSLLIVGLVSVAICGIGYLVFKKLEKGFAEEV